MKITARYLVLYFALGVLATLAIGGGWITHMANTEYQQVTVNE